MRALIQRVARASVIVDDRITGHIDSGLLVFLGIRTGDTEEEAAYLAARVAALRIFNDSEGKMNLSVRETGGKILVVSQFTLHADTRKGNRPSFVDAAEPVLAEQLYEYFLTQCRTLHGADSVSAGVFRAMMRVELVNDGPVTLLLGSKSEYAQEPGIRL